MPKSSVNRDIQELKDRLFAAEIEIENLKERLSGELPAPSRKDVWVDRLAQCFALPGEWVMVWQFPSPASAKQAVKNLKNGKYRKPNGNWEFRQRQGQVWAMFAEDK